MIDFRSFEAFLVMGTMLFLVGQALLMFWPKLALRISFFALLVAGTKFRGGRGSQTLIGGDVDAQVYFELVVYGLVLAIVLWNLVTHINRLKRAYPFEVMIFLYIMLVFMSSLWSPVFALTIVRALQLLIIFTLVFVSLRILGVTDTLKSVAICLLVYVLLFASIALVFPWASWATASYRFSWFGTHPGTSANLIALAMVMLIAMFMNRKDFWSKRWVPIPHWFWLVPVIAFLTYILVATHTRGAFLACVGTVAGLWVVKRFHLTTSMFIGSLTGVFLAVIVLGSGIGTGFVGLGLQSETIIGDYMLRGRREEGVFTLSGRTGLWMDMLKLIADKPILGRGYQSTRVILPSLRDWSTYAHNGFMQTLFDLGIVGIILLWYPVLKTVTGCLRYNYGSQPPQRAHFNFMLGTLIYILIYSTLNESFSGTPSYDHVVTFTCVMAYEKLYYENWSSVSAPNIDLARS